MKINFNLENFKLDGYEIGTGLEYNGKSIPDNNDIQKLIESANMMNSLFFQEEATFTEKELKEIDIDPDELIDSLIYPFFEYPERAAIAVNNTEYDYDDLLYAPVEDERGSIFDVNLVKLGVYHEDDLRKEIKEIEVQIFQDSVSPAIIDSVDMIEEYFDVLDKKKLVKELKKELTKDDLEEYEDLDDEEFILKATYDFEGEITELLEDNDFIDLEKYVDTLHADTQSLYMDVERDMGNVLADMAEAEYLGKTYDDYVILELH